MAALIVMRRRGENRGILFQSGGFGREITLVQAAL